MNHEASLLERLVAREHWRPILMAALVQATLLVGLAALFVLPAAPALALIHLVTCFAAISAAMIAPRLAEMGKWEPAVRIGRRGMGSLAVAAASLLGLMVLT